MQNAEWQKGSGKDKGVLLNCGGKVTSRSGQLVLKEMLALRHDDTKARESPLGSRMVGTKEVCSGEL